MQGSSQQITVLIFSAVSVLPHTSTTGLCRNGTQGEGSEECTLLQTSGLGLKRFEARISSSKLQDELLDVGEGTLVIATHHKAGSVLFQNVWRDIMRDAQTCQQLSKEGVPIAMEYDKDWRQAKRLQYCDHHDSYGCELWDTCPEDLTTTLVRMTWQEGAGLKKFLHLWRDPVELVVSAYQYHRVTTEWWALMKMNSFQWQSSECHPYGELPGLTDLQNDAHWGNFSYQEYLTMVDKETGLRAEFNLSMAWNIGDMLETLKLAENLADEQRVFYQPVRFLDNLTSDFNATFERLFREIGYQEHSMQRLIDIASAHDIHLHPPQGAKSVHISDPEEKPQLRRLLARMGREYAILQRARASLGFHIVGKETH